MNTETEIKTEYFIQYSFENEIPEYWHYEQEVNDDVPFKSYAAAEWGLKEAMINCDEGISWRIIKVQSTILTTVYPQDFSK